jgi:DNA mismatch repair protein MutS2
MDIKSTETLELPTVLERLADHAVFSASKGLARSIEPSIDLDEVQRWQRETTEARLLLSLNPTLSVGGVHDVRSQVEAAKRNAVLEPVQLLDIKSTMVGARNIKRLLESSQDEVPLLAAYAQQLELIPGLVDSISKVLDERGSVQDNASDKLASIRRDLRVVQDRLTSKLQRLVSDPDVVHMLQEPIITQRDGRFVIPLRSEFKGRIQSVIHDRSSSGATLFIEPLSIVDLNNEVRELELAERDEVRRILAELSNFVGQHAFEIEGTVEALAALDLAFAKARYAETLHAHEPIVHSWPTKSIRDRTGSAIHLIHARHPLLKPDQVVPIDLRLDDGVFALVITGPNTGGKTVALKTAGLMALMAQCGLHLPVESGSMIAVFNGIYADIGDEQSIEQSLSTFSSHISKIIQILEEAGPQFLVLLDELGAGTDPQEGSALARALLSEFLERRSITLIATHYPELKAYAHVTEGVCNASVEFDLESLQPTYHLTIGLPGRSNALAIAERLGLGKDIVERARQLIAPQDLKVESLLDEIHRQRDAVSEALAEAEEVRQEVKELRGELEGRLSEVESERRAILQEAQHEAEAELEALREEMSGIRRRLAAAAQPLVVLEAIEEEVEDLEEEVSQPITLAAFSEDVDQRAFQLGDRVRVGTIEVDGVITDLDQNKAEVQIGQLRVRAALEELSLLESSNLPKMPTTSKSPKTRHPTKGVEPHLQAVPPLELDLRGFTVEEALTELERRLDAAFLAGMPFIRVIHGKGTGRLRQAVRQALKDAPYVKSFQTGHPGEGGDGVTVVKIVAQ